MQINESLRFFRKNNDQTLKDILPTKNNPKQSPSKLSRFELGTERVSIREFLEILDNVSIAPEEILKFSNTDAQTEQQQYITLSTLCMKKPNSSKKNALLKYYKHLDSKEKKTTRELSNLLSIKFHFSKLWKKDIPPISQAEIEQVNTHLLNRKYYTKYDYSLLLMICTLLPEIQ
ncbi:hypothetical protein [Enterococcus rivorum]|uniref:hypothetical protein n=1 Tax=Enterococcus rivorum TaxID=762845 RepID=UPI0036386DB2